MAASVSPQGLSVKVERRWVWRSSPALNLRNMQQELLQPPFSVQPRLSHQKHSSVLTGFLQTSQNVDVCDVLQPVGCGRVVGALLIVVCAKHVTQIYDVKDSRMDLLQNFYLLIHDFVSVSV